MITLNRLIAAALLMSTACVFADEPDHHQVPYTGSTEFERLKTLAGNWQGTTMMEGKEQEIQVNYKVTSASSTVIETHFPGTPQEMVTVYHEEDGRPNMTHYCALKNRPNLVMESSSMDSIHFDFTDSSSIDPTKDTHMHALTVRFIDKDTIEQEWVMYQDGKPANTSTFTLRRVENL